MELIPICEKDLQLAENVWYALSPTGSLPSMRVGHTAIYVKHEQQQQQSDNSDDNDDDLGSVYLLGGANPRECFDQIHRLDLNTHQWSLLADKSIGVGGRYEHACFRVEGGGHESSKVYVFGGANLEANLNDLVCLDLAANSVEPVKSEGKLVPRERTVHTGATFRSRLVVFGGGSDGRRALDDAQVHLFDTTSCKWISLPMSGAERPQPRQGHVMIGGVGGEDEHIYLHGGMDADVFYDDLWLLDFGKFAWTKLKPQTPAPSGRAAHAGVSSGKNLFVFGGLTSVGLASDELWRCNTETLQWTLITDCGDRPASRLDLAYCKLRLPVKGPENSDATATVASGQSHADVLFIHGGMDTQGNVFDDAFMIRLA